MKGTSIRRWGFGLAGALAAGSLALFMSAGPALASNPCTAIGSGGDACTNTITATVTVPTTETLTLSTTTLNFGTVPDGTSASATEGFTVSGNDPNGFDLAINAGDVGTPWMQGSEGGGAADQIPNSDITVNDSITGLTPAFSPTSINDLCQAVTQCTPDGPISPDATGTDTWTIHMPGSQMGDTYSETFDYILTLG